MQRFHVLQYLECFRYFSRNQADSSGIMCNCYGSKNTQASANSAAAHPRGAIETGNWGAMLGASTALSCQPSLASVFGTQTLCGRSKARSYGVVQHVFSLVIVIRLAHWCNVAILALSVLFQGLFTGKSTVASCTAPCLSGTLH